MKSSKSSLFLLELIISILFFSVSAAACIQLFVKAHTIDVTTREQNQAIIWSQNLAELWRTGKGSLSFIEEQLQTDYLFPKEAVVQSTMPGTSSQTLTLSFDKSWNLQSSNTAYYIVFTSDSSLDEKKLLHANISFYKNDKSTPFYQLPLVLHITDKEVTCNE